MKKNILIAEDDNDIIELLKLYLEVDNFNTFIANNGNEALNILSKEKIDLALVDIMMPEKNGYDFIKEVRKNNNKLPIIIMSAKSMDTDKILGLNIGADMYITKPFNPLEVIANINALLRRCNLLDNKINIIKYDNLSLDLDKYILTKDDKIINLTSTEIKILIKLMKNPNRIFTKSQLYECINGEVFDASDNAMMVHIFNIRSKIEDDSSNPKYIKTIKGLGYKFEYEEK